QLETLEQEEQECLELKPHPTEKSIHMVSHQNGMTVTKTTQEGEAEPQRQSFSYSQAELRGLLLEGASLLLLRVLARRQTAPSGLMFPAIDTEGQLCISTY
ncbi:CATIP protein, partial [Serilophus lunatus]|nr:CATIP protein [Serilophus lunatus]